MFQLQWSPLTLVNPSIIQPSKFSIRAIHLTFLSCLKVYNDLSLSIREINILIIFIACKLLHPLWKRVCRFLRKLKLKIFVWHISRQKRQFKEITGTTTFIAALITITKTWKQLKCPLMDEWGNNMQHIHTKEYYSAVKEKKICHLWYEYNLRALC